MTESDEYNFLRDNRILLKIPIFSPENQQKVGLKYHLSFKSRVSCFSKDLRLLF